VGELKVFGAIADSFVAEGVDLVFSLMGDSNMMFHDDLVRRHGVHVVNARHENAAVAMADGFARATGKVGVATVTCGPGLTQIMTSLTAASRMRVPLVIFVGDSPSQDLWNPQHLDFGANILPTGAIHIPIRSAERIAQTVQLAFIKAAQYRLPVVISIPYDLQDKIAPLNFSPLLPMSRDLSRGIVFPSQAQIMEAAELLTTAKRPVIVAGLGAVLSDARDPIMRLAERTGALLATSLKAKEWFEGESWNIGVCGVLGTTTGRDLISEADVIIGVGAQLGFFSSENGQLFPNARIVHVDLAPGDPIEGTPFHGLLITADARLGVEALDAALERVEHRSVGYRTAEVAERISNPVEDWLPTPAEPGRLDPTLAIRELDAAVVPEQLYVFGVGHFWSFAAMYTHRLDPRDYIYAYAFGSIGLALSNAIGASLGLKRPTVLVDGDGSLLMHIGELGTVVSENLDMTIFVMNDGGYGSEIHKLNAKGGDGELARFHDTDFVTVARGFGLDAYRAHSLNDIAQCVREQRRSRRPTLIDVPMIRAAVSPSTRRNWTSKGK